MFQMRIRSISITVLLFNQQNLLYSICDGMASTLPKAKPDKAPKLKP